MVQPALVIKRTVQANRKKVFEAWTQADSLKKWFLPLSVTSVKVNMDLREGGSYRIDMKTAEGDLYIHTGEYKEIIPYEKLVFTWNSDWAKNTLVTVELKDAGEGTEITLTHEMLPTDETRQEHQRGWTSIFDKLEDTI